MKKTRFLAGLLCIMMVLTLVPMMAMAAPTAALYNAIGEAMGKTSSKPLVNETWLSMNLDFTDSFDQTDSITKTEGVSYENTNGLNFPKTTDGTWKYMPRPEGWTPLVFGAYYLRFKLDEGGTLGTQAAAYYAVYGRAYVDISTTGVTVYSSKDNDDATDLVQGAGQSVVANANNYVPGTDWNDMVVVANGGMGSSAGGYSVYMKKPTDEKFTLVAKTNAYREGNNAWKGTGLTLYGHDSYVSDAIMLEGSDTLAVDPVYYDSIEEIMGVENVVPKKSIAFNASYTPENVTGAVTTTVPADITYTDANGAHMLPTNDNTALYYYEGAASKNYSPLTLDGSTAFVTKMKLVSANDKMTIQANKPGGNARAYIDVTATGITAAGSTHGGDATSNAENAYSTTALAIGTDWLEVMMVANSGGYNVYAKSDTATNGKWLLTHNVSGWRFNRAGGISISPLQKQHAPTGVDPESLMGVYLKDIIVYRGAGPQYNSLEEIAGKSPVAEYNFEFDETFETYGFNDGSADVGFVNAPGAAFTANGMDMTASSSFGYFRAHKAWTPMYNEYQKTAFAFKAKLVSGGTLNIQANAGDVSGRVFIDITNTGVGLTSATGVKNYGYEPGTSWVDYFVMRKDGGYAVYAKGEADSKWEMAVYCTGYRSSSATGLQFSGTGGYIKNFRVYNVVDGVAEASTLPSGATELLYGEEFAAVPTYANAKLTGESYASENLVLTTNAETDANLSLWNVAIPAGGYADIKVKSNANQDITFYDGETSLQFVLKKTYGVVSGAADTSAWIADDNNSYRIWRVAKNDDKTYNVYTKAACDDAWLTVGTNIAGKASANSAVIAIKQGANINGSGNGVGSIDYIKVYGSAPADILTLTDGYGTVAVSDGAALSYPQDLYAKVKQDTAAKVILFAEYDEETGILTNVVREVVPAGSGVVSVPYSIVGKKVKVFLWDDATHANLLDVTNLTAKK